MTLKNPSDREYFVAFILFVISSIVLLYYLKELGLFRVWHNFWYI